jgi:hypothetical protein
MGELFNEAWMRRLQQKWNADPNIVMPLGQAGFSARIAYGFKGEENPRGILVIEHGKAVEAGRYVNGPLDWDLRAEPGNWEKWIREGFGLTRLGPAVATGALHFASGNYRQMIRNPSLSHPFLHHFNLISEIGTGG